MDERVVEGWTVPNGYVPRRCKTSDGRLKGNNRSKQSGIKTKRGMSRQKETKSSQHTSKVKCWARHPPRDNPNSSNSNHLHCARRFRESQALFSIIASPREGTCHAHQPLFYTQCISIRLGDESSSFLVGRNPSIPRNSCIEFVASPNTRWRIGFPISSVMISTLVQGSQAPQVGSATFARFDSNVVQATVWMVERPSSFTILPFRSSLPRMGPSLPLPLRIEISLFLIDTFRGKISFPIAVPAPSKTRKAARFDRETGSVLFLPRTGLRSRWRVFLSGRVRCGCPTVVNHGCESSV